jgi:hypothetical protein
MTMRALLALNVSYAPDRLGAPIAFCRNGAATHKSVHGTKRTCRNGLTTSVHWGNADFVLSRSDVAF